MSRLKGKTALITGASRGIGRAIAHRLAADGALAIIHYGKSADGARETLGLIEAEGGSGFIAQADLRHPSSITPMFQEIARQLEERGKTGLDILVNNAGNLIPGTIDTLTDTQFEEAFAIGVRAPFFVTQGALSHLREGGRIINISSATTRIVHPGVISYAMAKGALEVFSKTLAQHLGERRITVNTVSPGPTATEEFLRLTEGNPEFVQQELAKSALRRLGTPEDIANIVAFLASEDSGWITGQLIDATGGSLLG
jgi:NAD(P)-dependent dehydrogenase (short-subunit alcohol dehydrogenase family)